MIKAEFFDSAGNSENGDLGWPGFVDDAVDWIKDKATDAGGAVKDAGAWVIDKTCSAATDPKTQAAAAAAGLVPSGWSQVGAGAVLSTGAACAVFMPAGIPPIPGPDVTPLPSMLKLQMFSRPKAASPVPVAPKVVPGTIAAFDPKRGGYRVAVPGLPGFSGPSAFTEVSTQSALPAGARLVALDTFEKETGTAKPWFKKPLVLGGIAAGLVVLGGGGYLLLR